MKVLVPLFSPQTGTLGSLTRTMALARAFTADGHEVSFCASGRIAQSLVAKGLRVHVMPAPTMFGLPGPLSRLMERRSTQMRIPVREGKSIGSIWFVYRLSGMLSPRYLPRLVEAELAAVASVRPDLLVTEMDPGAYLLARVTGLPLVTTYAAVMQVGRGTGSWRKALGAMNAVLARHGKPTGVDPAEIAFRGRVLKIIPSIPELDGTEETADVRYVGNMTEPVSGTEAPFAPEPGKRYVFVYLGTGSVPFSRAVEVLPAALAPFAELLCIVGSPTVTSPFEKGNVSFVSYAPANRILPHCDCVICHGGLNTITQSLEAGVPLLLFPGPIFERRFNAAAVARNGAGAFGELGQFTPRWLGVQIARRREYAAAARKLSGRFATGGADAAVRRIVAWWGQGG